MANDKGWIKLYYHLRDDAIWNSNEPFDDRSAYIDLLLTVNFKASTVIGNKSKKVIEIPENACLRSMQYFAQRWRWSANKVRRYFSRLKRLGLVHIDGCVDGTVETLMNTSVKNE